MTYLRLDDKMPEHPKVARLSDRAFRIHIQGLCYCQRNLSDGVIPKAVADPWGKRAISTELVARDMWVVRSAEDYEIADYLDWNDSRESVRNRRGKDAERKKESARIPDGIPIDTATALVPVASSVLKNEESAEFVEFYERAYPRREARAVARKAWAKAIEKVDAATIIAGALRFATDPNREAAFTPHPASWLNAERWNDEPLPRRVTSLRHQDRAAEILNGAWDEAR